MAARSLLIPVKKLTAASGFFRFPSRCVLASPRTTDLLPLSQLAGDLKEYPGTTAKIESNVFGPATVRVMRDSSIQGQDRYRLQITPKGVVITASADSGAYYGIQTLRELLAIHGKGLPCRVIEDWPDFARRGVYHDCSRGKVPTLETLKALVERLARWKINELQLYVENVFTFARHPAIGRGYSPFTPEELLSLQDHCKLHHVRLVGSLSSFGHMEKILCLPRYQNLSETPSGVGSRGGSTLCPVDPRSIKLVGELYEEFMPLFEAADFNVCCDETCPFDAGRSKRRSANIGAGRVYLEFLLKIRKLCLKHGKRMNAWADIVLKHGDLLGDVPKDIVMLNWDYGDRGKRIYQTGEIAETGLPQVVCPGTSSWQAHGTRLANAIGNVANFAEQGRKWGVEGLLNTDWGDSGHRNLLGVSLHGFAHGAAHAWHGRGVDDKTFTDTFFFHAFAQRDSRLASSFRKLGSTYSICSKEHRNSCALYHVLVEPMVLKKGKGGQIKGTDPKGLRRIVKMLDDSRLWPAPVRGMDRFEALAMLEFPLAARMDVLACRRALAAKELRAGNAVSPTLLRGLAADMRELAEDFSLLWLARSKPSRLADNLTLMSRVEKESLRLAKR